MQGWRRPSHAAAAEPGKSCSASHAEKGQSVLTLLGDGTGHFGAVLALQEGQSAFFRCHGIESHLEIVTDPVPNLPSNDKQEQKENKSC